MALAAAVAVASASVPPDAVAVRAEDTVEVYTREGRGRSAAARSSTLDTNEAAAAVPPSVEAEREIAAAEAAVDTAAALSAGPEADNLANGGPPRIPPPLRAAARAALTRAGHCAAMNRRARARAAASSRRGSSPQQSPSDSDASSFTLVTPRVSASPSSIASTPSPDGSIESWRDISWRAVTSSEMEDPSSHKTTLRPTTRDSAYEIDERRPEPGRPTTNKLLLSADAPMLPTKVSSCATCSSRPGRMRGGCSSLRSRRSRTRRMAAVSDMMLCQGLAQYLRVTDQLSPPRDDTLSKSDP